MSDQDTRLFPRENSPDFYGDGTVKPSDGSDEGENPYSEWEGQLPDEQGERNIARIAMIREGNQQEESLTPAQRRDANKLHKDLLERLNQPGRVPMSADREITFSVTGRGDKLNLGRFRASIERNVREATEKEVGELRAVGKGRRAAVSAEQGLKETMIRRREEAKQDEIFLRQFVGRLEKPGKRPKGEEYARAFGQIESLLAAVSEEGSGYSLEETRQIVVATLQQAPDKSDASFATWTKLAIKYKRIQRDEYNNRATEIHADQRANNLPKKRLVRRRPTAADRKKS